MVPQSVIDHAVLTNYIYTVSDPELKTYWLNTINDDDNAKQISQIEQEISTLQTKKTRLINAITEGIIEFADAKQKRIELDAATNACKKRIAELETEPEEEPNWDNISITADEMEKAATAEKRTLLQSAIKNIEISQSRLILTYKFPRNPSCNRTAEIKLPKPGIGGPKRRW